MIFPIISHAEHILIKSLLKEGFENKLIASEASCSVRAVQRIRLKRQRFQMLSPRTNRVGRRSCITSPMQKALCDILIEQPYLYRYEMADFLYRRFRKRILDISLISSHPLPSHLSHLAHHHLTHHHLALHECSFAQECPLVRVV